MKKIIFKNWPFHWGVRFSGQFPRNKMFTNSLDHQKNRVGTSFFLYLTLSYALLARPWGAQFRPREVQARPWKTWARPREAKKGPREAQRGPSQAQGGPIQALGRPSQAKGDSNPSLEGQISAWMLKSQPRGSNYRLDTWIPDMWLKFQPKHRSSAPLGPLPLLLPPLPPQSTTEGQREPLSI